MSLYLSQLILNPRDRNVRRDLADCHALHRTLMRAFPRIDDAGDTGGARERFGLLHRVEVDPRSGAVRVLAQSFAAPDWEAIRREDAGYFLDLPDGRQNPDCKPIDAKFDALAAGDALVFRLRANPTRRVSNRNPATAEDKLRCKRVELQSEEEWNAWLARKGERGGFRVTTVRSVADANAFERGARLFGLRSERDLGAPVPDARAIEGLKTTGVKQIADRSRRLTFGSVLFEGRLVVADADAFRLTLERGIGSGKAYGFGLLSVAPDRAAN